MSAPHEPAEMPLDQRDRSTVQPGLEEDLARVTRQLRRVTVQILGAGVGAGCGVIWSADGLIATNAHVARGGVDVVLPDGRRVSGHLLVRDPDHDSAEQCGDALSLVGATPGDAAVITVLVAAPTMAARAGLAARLSAYKRLHVVVEATALPLSDQLDTTQSDVVLADVGSEAASAWLRDLAGTRRLPAIVMLADDARGALAGGTLRSGARAVLPRHATTEEIVAAIEAVAAGLVVLHPDTLDAFVPPASRRERSRDSIDHQPLTPREIEVLAMMAEGLGNKLIAARLAISEHTVKFHIASIFAKLNAGSRTEAVTIGLRQGAIMI